MPILFKLNVIFSTVSY